MAVLEKIRVKFGILITVLIGVALLSFIVDPSTLETTLRYFSSKYDVGKIDGNRISYEEYQSKLDYYTKVYNLTTGNQAVSESAMENLKETAWQSLISDLYIIPQMESAGIAVGEEELIDMSQGKEISPVIAQDPIFMDATGNFSREQLLEFIQSIPTDASGNLAMYWDFLQTNMTNQQYFTKYTSLISQSNIITPVELRRMVEENNTTSDVNFVMVPFGFANDTTIVVSDKEIKDFYNKNKEQFKQIASRDIEYIVVDIVPSSDDVVAANNAIASVYEDFQNAENMRNFLLSKSERQFDKKWYKEGDLKNVSAEVDAFVAAAKVGDVSPIFQNGNSFYAVKVMESAKVPEQVEVKYVQAGEGAEALLADAQAQWVSQMDGFEDLMTTPKGQTVTINGLLFQVVDTKDEVLKKRVAILEKTAQPSDATRSACYAKANSVASKAGGKYDGFKKAVEEDGLYAHPYNKMPESANRLGSVEHAKEVTRWAFDAKVGDVSNIISIDNKYYVVAHKKARYKVVAVGVELVDYV